MILVEIGFAWKRQRGGRKRRLETDMHKVRKRSSIVTEGLELLQDVTEQGADQVDSGTLQVQLVKKELDFPAIRNPNSAFQCATGTTWIENRLRHQAIEMQQPKH
jgi:hypothetical protein